MSAQNRAGNDGDEVDAGAIGSDFVWRDCGWPDNPRVDAQEQIVTLDHRSGDPSESVVAGHSCAWVSTALAPDLRAPMALSALSPVRIPHGAERAAQCRRQRRFQRLAWW